MAVNDAETKDPAERGWRGERVRRPWLMGVLAASAAASIAAAVFGLADLSRSLAARPLSLVQGAGEIEAVLEAAPWVALAEGGPVVWVVSPARCDSCLALFAEEIPEIEADGAEVRVIIVSSRSGSDGAEQAWTARFAQARDVTLAEALANEAPLPAGARMDGAEQDGYLEWGRAASDRVAGIIGLNGRDLELPALFWQRGPEWRALVGDPLHAADHVTREL